VNLFHCIFIFGAISYLMLSVVYHDACVNYQIIIRTGTTSYALLHYDCFNVLTDTDLNAFIPTRRHASV